MCGAQSWTLYIEMAKTAFERRITVPTSDAPEPGRSDRVHQTRQRPRAAPAERPCAGWPPAEISWSLQWGHSLWCHTAAVAPASHTPSDRQDHTPETTDTSSATNTDNDTTESDQVSLFKIKFLPLQEHQRRWYTTKPANHTAPPPSLGSLLQSP